jgi:hypothetical protein
MGNLRQSMTDEEWNAMGLAMGLVPEEERPMEATNNVHHPKHYGGKDNPYEAIKIIEAYDLNFQEGCILKYLLRYKKKNGIEDLWKAHWYLTRLIKQQEEKI